MDCKHTAAEMVPLQAGDEVEIAEVTAGKLENIGANQSPVNYFSKEEGILCIRSHLVLTFSAFQYMCDLVISELDG